jgi:aspartyl-tRNA synthetase
VDQDDVLNTFEGMFKHLFREIKGLEMEEDFPRMTYDEAMIKYGSDKPDLRFGMEFIDLTAIVKGNNFVVFDSAEYVGAIIAKGCAAYSRKDIDKLTDFVKSQQVGARGLVYVKYNEDGTIKSSVDKFYSEEDLRDWIKFADAEPGDLILILAGDLDHTRNALGVLRLEMGDRLELRDPDVFVPLWVIDFPLLEWDEDSGRFHAMHHPFTSPRKEDIGLMESDPGKVKAIAHDLVINGVEIGGGSIRIHDSELQSLMFKTLGFTKEEAEKQFGFILNAFKFGAPPHGGIALGFDRMVSLFDGSETIRDYIAFPKNNQGRDVMIDSPSQISDDQLDELSIAITKKQ